MVAAEWVTNVEAAEWVTNVEAAEWVTNVEAAEWATNVEAAEWVTTMESSGIGPGSNGRFAARRRPRLEPTTKLAGFTRAAPSLRCARRTWMSLSRG